MSYKHKSFMTRRRHPPQSRRYVRWQIRREQPTIAYDALTYGERPFIKGLDEWNV